MRIITDKAKNEIGKRLSAIFYIASHGYGKDTASDIDSTTKIIENLYEIAYKVGGERFSNVEMPAYVWKLQSAIQRGERSRNGGREMTLHEFLKPLTKRSLDEYVALLLAGGKVYDGKIRDIPAFYILNPYTVKTVELNWGAQSLTVALNVPEEE